MKILIVESKAKCKTLLKYLGKEEWRVLATGGHVRRLADDRKVHPPKEVKKAYWAHVPGSLPDPPWFWTERGEASIEGIRTEAASHDSVEFYLAPDPDREGERIAWHLQGLLSDLGPCRRVTFQEITKPAVLDAIANPRQIDQPLVDAALIRTFIDRVVGWRSKGIAKKFATTKGGSMGRVQTPTLGFVVERELEREAHVPVRYYEVIALTSLTEWKVLFHDKDDDDAWRDENGRFVASRTGSEALARTAHKALQEATGLTVQEVVRRERAQLPRPPFSTDVLIQAAGGRWGWSPKKTSALAGQLYEAGLLTYIRTDSTRLAPEAVEAGRRIIEATWRKARVGSVADQASGAGAQDAHEAIRPTDLDQERGDGLEPDAQRLYALVRARTLASLMISAQRVTLAMQASCDGMEQRLKGDVGWYSEPGWRHAFVAAGLEHELDTEPRQIERGTLVALTDSSDAEENPILREGQTEPPPRYREHTLVKAMKSAGIGRPSTYASTVQVLLDRGYVTLEEKTLAPTPGGRNVWLDAAPLFVLADDREAFQVDYTAGMEAMLDDVASGRRSAVEVWESMLGDFKRAHEAALEASKAGPLLPRTRRQLVDYLAAEQTLANEIGPLDELTEAKGRTLLADLGTRGIELLPTEAQLAFLEELLEATELTLPEATESAGLDGRASFTRPQASLVIDHLTQLKDERRGPTRKQLAYIDGLAKKLDLDELEVCAIAGVASLDDLSGGREGSASALIERLQQLKHGGDQHHRIQ